MPSVREIRITLVQLCSACKAATVHGSARSAAQTDLGPERQRQLATAWAALLDRTSAIADDMALRLLADEPSYTGAGK